MPKFAVAASLLLHGLLVWMLVATPLRPPLRHAPAIVPMRLVTMHLVEISLPDPDGREMPEPEPALGETVEPSSGPAPESPPSAAPEIVDADAVNADAGQDSPPPPGAVLRDRVLEQIGRLEPAAGKTPEGGPPWAPSGEAVPGLPGVRGWLSGYAGAVAPSTSTWQENDGSRRARHVLADGTVVCTRRRAPIIDELMNPWKSLIVTMGSICGRERPEAPDFDDPRVQPPPSRAGRTGPGE